MRRLRRSLAVGVSEPAVSTTVLQVERGGPELAVSCADSSETDEQGEPIVGAPRVHGELLKLGFEIAESTVSKYMIRRRGPPSQTWRTFLRNHAEAIAEIDLCVGPTLTFESLFAFLVVGLGVTRHPRLQADPWPTARLPAPIGPKSYSVPPQDRVRLNDAGQTEQTWPEPSHPHQ
jgi:hypothetical protein